MKARDYNPAVKYGAKWYPEDIVGFPYMTKGDYWFVDGDVAASHGGKSWDNAFKTINEAIAVAGDDDRVFVSPGQYKEDDTIAITQSNFALVAAQTGPGRALIRTEIRQHGNNDVDCISINGAHNVEIAGFRITPRVGTNHTGIAVSGTAASYGVWIHDCYHYSPAQVGTVAIEMGSASFDADSLVIENNDFWVGGGGALAVIDWRLSTRGMVRGNTFTTTGGAGVKTIDCYDNGNVMGMILDNYFFAKEGGHIEISVSTDRGDFYIAGNHFAGQSGAGNCFDWVTAVNAGGNWYNGAQITS